MSYLNRGKIPEKFIIRPQSSPYLTKNNFVQTYYNGGKFENEDFIKNNELIKDKKIADIIVYNPKKPIRKGDIVVENKPIKLKLVGVKNNAYGASNTNYAFYVLLQDYLISFSSEILLESILKDGSKKEGELKSDFIVAINNNRTVFIRKDSLVHEACKIHMKNLEKPILKDMSFNFGDIYEKANGDLGVFLGYVTTNIVKPKITYELKKNEIGNEYFYIKDITLINKKIKMATLWYEVNRYTFDKISDKDIIEKIKSTCLLSLSSEMPHVKCYNDNKHKYIVLSKYGKIDIGTPKDIIYSVLNKYNNIIKNRFERLKEDDHNLTNIKTYLSIYSGTSMLTHLYDVCSFSDLGNMEIYGCMPTINKCYKLIEKDLLLKIIDIYNKSPKTHK